MKGRLFPAVFLAAGFLLPAGIPAAPPALPGGYRLLAREGKGLLLEKEGLKILRLEGSPFERGRQHGVLLRDQVRALVKRVLLLGRTVSTGKNPFPGGALREAWRRARPFLKKEHLEELRGLAAGAGLPLEEVQEANILPELFHCSGFALMGRATKDGRLLHGRILDYMTGAGLQEAAVAIVEKPERGIPFLNAGFAGFLGSVTGFNAAGIALGEMGGRGEGAWDGMPMAFLVRKVLEEARSLEEALRVFRETPRTCEYYYVVSDGKIPDARGLYCTPKEFQVLLPGRPHPKLPVPPLPDTVLMSGGERLRLLRRRTARGYGSFGVKEALALMERPVAMKSNLQCALMDPALLTIHLAYAADPNRKERFQACFQPYVPISLHQVLRLEPERREGRDGRSASRPAASRPARKAPGAVQVTPALSGGVVPPGPERPLKPAGDPALKKLLRGYALPGKGFSWTARRQARFSRFHVYDLRFPSPLRSPDPENNVVPCELYLVPGREKRPAAVVLHILDGKFRVARLISQYLAGRGIHALLLKMAYYGPRRPKDPKRFKRLSEDLPTLLSGVRQTVLDIRRAAFLLSRMPQVDPRRISIAGVSLGGFLAALASGVDGGFHRTGIILAGGRLEKVFTSDAREARSLKRYLLARGLTGSKLARLLAPIEPCNFASRIPRGSILMVNADADPVVPPECARAFARAAGGVKIHWIHGNHYALLRRALPVLKMLGDHLDS